LAVVTLIPVSSVFAQTEDIASRFYFPGSIGVSIPAENNHTQLSSGIALTTAIEYRPTYIDDIFYRFDFDVHNNNYNSYVPTIPTNIIKGKLSTDFLVFGAGYRGKVGKWGIYGLVQPGLGIHSFNRAVYTPDGVVLNNVTSSAFAVKIDFGIEYYITRHFALTFDPAFYKLLSHKGFNNSHSSFTAFNIGITTSIF
jgi:hypothetical protein